VEVFEEQLQLQTMANELLAAHREINDSHLALRDAMKSNNVVKKAGFKFVWYYTSEGIQKQTKLFYQSSDMPDQKEFNEASVERLGGPRKTPSTQRPVNFFWNRDPSKPPKEYNTFSFGDRAVALNLQGGKESALDTLVSVYGNTSHSSSLTLKRSGIAGVLQQPPPVTAMMYSEQRIAPRIAHNNSLIIREDGEGTPAPPQHRSKAIVTSTERPTDSLSMEAAQAKLLSSDDENDEKSDDVVGVDSLTIASPNATTPATSTAVVVHHSSTRRGPASSAKKQLVGGGIAHIELDADELALYNNGGEVIAPTYNSAAMERQFHAVFDPTDAATPCMVEDTPCLVDIEKIPKIKQDEYVAVLVGVVFAKLTADARVQHATIGFHNFLKDEGKTNEVDFMEMFERLKQVCYKAFGIVGKGPPSGAGKKAKLPEGAVSKWQQYYPKNNCSRRINNVLFNIAELIVNLWLQLEKKVPIDKDFFFDAVTDVEGRSVYKGLVDNETVAKLIVDIQSLTSQKDGSDDEAVDTEVRRGGGSQQLKCLAVLLRDNKNSNSKNKNFPRTTEELFAEVGDPDKLTAQLDQLEADKFAAKEARREEVAMRRKRIEADDKKIMARIAKEQGKEWSKNTANRRELKELMFKYRDPSLKDLLVPVVSYTSSYSVKDLNNSYKSTSKKRKRNTKQNDNDEEESDDDDEVVEEQEIDGGKQQRDPYADMWSDDVLEDLNENGETPGGQEEHIDIDMALFDLSELEAEDAVLLEEKEEEEKEVAVVQPKSELNSASASGVTDSRKVNRDNHAARGTVVRHDNKINDPPEYRPRIRDLFGQPLEVVKGNANYELLVGMVPNKSSIAEVTRLNLDNIVDAFLADCLMVPTEYTAIIKEAMCTTEETLGQYGRAICIARAVMERMKVLHQDPDTKKFNILGMAGKLGNKHSFTIPANRVKLLQFFVGTQLEQMFGKDLVLPFYMSKFPALLGKPCEYAERQFVYNQLKYWDEAKLVHVTINDIEMADTLTGTMSFFHTDMFRRATAQDSIREIRKAIETVSIDDDDEKDV